MLTMIANHLHKFPLKRPKPDPKNTHIAAAVLVVLHGQDDDPQVILTQRAFHLKSHAGEVAFPGGMWDQIDEDLMQTALREAQEEIGLAADSVTLLATMPISSPRRRDISVTPFVAVANSMLELNPDDGEIEAIFNAPLKAFMHLDHYEYFDMQLDAEYGGGVIRFPFLMYKNYKIWGFTLNVITDLLNATLGAGIDLEYPTHEKLEKLTKEA